MRVVLRGGGDLGSGVAVRLHRAGFRVLIAEIPSPLAVRRLVSFSEAIYEGSMIVEGVESRLLQPGDGDFLAAIEMAHRHQVIPVIVDPDLEISRQIAPPVVVDCRMRKKPPGESPIAASLIIGLGPGFHPGENCHAAVETNRGHHLGRVYWQGLPAADTGEPDPVLGHSWDRVLRAPAPGELATNREIGETVKAGEVIASVDGQPIQAKFDGVLRGLLRPGSLVEARLKVGDVDPRGVPEYCWTVSDKARAIGGGVLEAIMEWQNRGGRPPV